MYKSHELIELLKQGYVLVKPHGEDYSTTEHEFLVYFKDHEEFEVKGWGSAIGPLDMRIPKRFEDIIRHPEKWKVLQNYHIDEGYPYPWSIAYNKELKYDSYEN